MRAITVKAFAKINLSLRIKEKRADGFHEVQTILQALDLSDRLTCEARRGPFQLSCTMPRVPTDRTNLVWRAAQRLWVAAGRDGEPCDATITLDKHIPMQSGLGGGSSDAAAALLALRQIWKVKVPDEDLLAIAGDMGCDVPYFFTGGTALGLGRGEEVYPLVDLPQWPVVLVVPPFGVATADAYEWLDAFRARGAVPPELRYLPDTWLGTTVPLVNDMEPPVNERHPVIGKVVERLTKLGAALAAMSGSGSTVFGIFTSATGARRALSAFQKTGAHALMTRMAARPTSGR